MSSNPSAPGFDAPEPTTGASRARRVPVNTTDVDTIRFGVPLMTVSPRSWVTVRALAGDEASPPPEVPPDPQPVSPSVNRTGTKPENVRLDIGLRSGFVM